MQDLGPLFVPPHEPERFWILIVLISIPVIAAALYVVVRGRLPSVLSAAGLLLLPVFAYILGDIYMLEQSKKVEFCGSCHVTMSPIVEALRNDGNSLAGQHYQRGAVPHESACYECHSGYGLLGDISAKRAGMMHMVNTVTHEYTFPIKKHGSFDIASCRSCHAAAAPFRAVEAHRDPDMQNLLLSGEMSCVGLCHLPAHPEDALYGTGGKEVATR